MYNRARREAQSSRKGAPEILDLFPVTSVRADTEALTEEQLNQLVKDCEQRHAAGYRENFIWGPVDLRMRVLEEDDHVRNFQAEFPNLFNSEFVRDEISSKILDRVISFCTSAQSSFEGSMIEGEQDGSDDDPDLLEDQQWRFENARRRQKRLLDMPEEARRFAKPDSIQEFEQYQRIKQEDPEEKLLKEALNCFNMDLIDVPVLLIRRRGDKVLKLSEMYNPVVIFNSIGSSGKGRVSFLKKNYRSKFNNPGFETFSDPVIDDYVYFPISSNLLYKVSNFYFHDDREDFEIANLHSSSIMYKSDELEEGHQTSFSTIEQFPWENNIAWDYREKNSSRNQFHKQRETPDEALEARDSSNGDSHEEVSNNNDLYDDMEEHDDFKGEHNEGINQNIQHYASHKFSRNGISMIRFSLSRKKRNISCAKENNFSGDNSLIPIWIADQKSVKDKWDFECSDKSISLKISEELNVKEYPLNCQFEAMEWMDCVQWDSAKPHDHVESVLVFDLNDKHFYMQNDENSFLETGNVYDLSNDFSKIYSTNSRIVVIGRTDVQHASFAKELIGSIFKPHLASQELRIYHRPLFTTILRSKLIDGFPVKNAISVERTIVGDSKRFVPKKESQLSIKEGRVILLEYIEERPCLLNKTGMESKFITFYRQKAEDDDLMVPELDDGTFKLISFEQEADETPFIVEMKPGTMISSLNNNMYTAPLFKHVNKQTDFILIANKADRTFYVREIPALYVTGQILPKVEVPAPNSRAASSYMKVRLSSYIYRHLRDETRVQISTISELFKDQSESSIRSELKEVAEFQRGGEDSGWWTKKPSWEPPKDSELEDMLTPESVCAFESMLAGKQYLEDLGITSLKTIAKLSAFVQRISDGNPLKEISVFMDEEIQLAPWNWTTNYVLAQKGQCFLKLRGSGNPLGNGQGFSFCLLNKIDESGNNPIAHATDLTGTDKDLRSIHNEELVKALRSFNVSLDEIKHMTRWQRVNRIRKEATDAVIAGIPTAYAKFARSTRNNTKALRKQYKIDARKLFDRQCVVLARAEPPSFSDDDLSDEDWLQGLEENMDVDESESPNSRARFEYDYQEEQKAYEQFRNEREERVANSNLLNVAQKKKKIIKKMILKRTLTFYSEDGSSKSSVSFIDDPKMVNDFIMDQKDGGSRFQDPIEELKSNQPSTSTDSAPKQKRKKKRSEGNTLNDLLQVEPQSNSPDSSSASKEPKPAKKRKPSTSSSSNSKSTKKPKPSPSLQPAISPPIVNNNNNANL
jgi:hypothetical protein